MSDNESSLVVRQYFEHPPRSHLYQGSPTGPSFSLARPPADAISREGKTKNSEGSGPGAGGGASESARQLLGEADGHATAVYVNAAPQDQKRSLSTLLLTGLMYTFTISGAYGIEESVKGGGALLTVVSILVIPVIMGAPTALVVAELASAVPSNAGFLMWIKLSFHRAVYLTMTILSVIYIATDNALYPTLFSENVCTAIGCSTTKAILFRLGMLAFTFVLNIFGVEAVGVASVVLTILTVLPFVLMFLIQQLSTGFYVNWPAMAYVPTGSISWPTFIATASWCLSGLEQAGSVVEDVKEPQRTIIGSLIPLMGLAFITYIPPIITGASVTHEQIDLSEWTTGYWVQVAYEVGGNWLEVVTVTGSILSAFGLTLSALCTTTRLLAGVALTDAFPGKISEWLSYRSARYGTYPWTLTFNTVITALLSLVPSFSALVQLDQCLYGIRVIVMFIAFYQIRYLYPHLNRPFHIPLSGWKLHLMMGIAFIAFAVLTVISALDWRTAVLCVGVVVGSGAVSFLYCHYYHQEEFLGRVVTEVDVAPLETGTEGFGGAAAQGASHDESWPNREERKVK